MKMNVKKKKQLLTQFFKQIESVIINNKAPFEIEIEVTPGSKSHNLLKEFIGDQNAIIHQILSNSHLNKIGNLILTKLFTSGEIEDLKKEEHYFNKKLMKYYQGIRYNLLKFLLNKINEVENKTQKDKKTEL